MLYELFRLEVAGGLDMAHRDADPSLMARAKRGNDYIRDFLSLRLTWVELLDRLESLGIDPYQYQNDIQSNFQDRGLPWLN